MEKNFDFIKNLLNNIPLLRWVRKYSADGLQDETIAKNFDIEVIEDSVCIADTGLVKMFFSSARFNGKTYVSFDIKQIKEVLSLIDGEGRLIINESDDKRLCFIQAGNNVVLVAPTTSETPKKESKAKKKTTKKSKEEDEEDSESEE
jgi:hypothetical protein